MSRSRRKSRNRNVVDTNVGAAVPQAALPPVREGGSWLPFFRGILLSVIMFCAGLYLGGHWWGAKAQKYDALMAHQELLSEMTIERAAEAFRVSNEDLCQQFRVHNERRETEELPDYVTGTVWVDFQQDHFMPYRTEEKQYIGRWSLDGQTLTVIWGPDGTTEKGVLVISKQRGMLRWIRGEGSVWFEPLKNPKQFTTTCREMNFDQRCEQ